MSFVAAQCKCHVEIPCRWVIGERAEAWAALHQARQLIAEDHALYLEAEEIADGWEAWLNLMEGSIPAAARWAAATGPLPEILHLDRTQLYVTLVRVLLAQGRAVEAIEALQRLEGWAYANGWQRVLLSIEIQRAVAEQRHGDKALALECLARAVQMAAPEDYRFAFMDADPAVLELLPHLYARSSRTASRFIKNLLANRSRGRREKPVGSDSHSPPALVDPLSERELEILALLAEGLSTPAIAEQLYISPGTAKWHTINIYRKVDVHSRIQAVNRAQELALL
jgi:LuxR family maltose regulon positive regulatory protein